MSDRLDENGIIDFYGRDAAVIAGKTVTTLGFALDFEAMACTAKGPERHDPDKRVSYLAGMLAAAGTLLPEHQHLVPPGRT